MNAEKQSGLVAAPNEKKEEVKVNLFDSLLPDELFCHLLSFLDIENACLSARVSQRWKTATNDAEAWRHRIQARFGLSNIEISKIRDKKHWFLCKLCADPYAQLVRSMSLVDRLEFAFEETLFQSRVDYRSWAMPLKALHSPIQDNVSIFLFFVQTCLLYLKLDGYIDYGWWAVFAPLWIFDILYIACVTIWFYFLAKGLITTQYADVCLKGWLKDVLNGIQMGHRWMDYVLFVIVSFFFFILFPVFLVTQMDLFSKLFFHVPGFKMETFARFQLPWTVCLSPLLAGSLIIVSVLHRRVGWVKRNREYYSLGLLRFLQVEFYMLAMFALLMSFHLDGLLPAFWSFWLTFMPVWVINIVAIFFASGGFHHNRNSGRMEPRCTLLQSGFITKSPMVILTWLFQVFLVDTIEHNASIGSPNRTFLFAFCYLFAVESLCVLFWLQDLFDLGGQRQYSTYTKKFNFSIKKALENKSK